MLPGNDLCKISIFLITPASNGKVYIFSACWGHPNPREQLNLLHHRLTPRCFSFSTLFNELSILCCTACHFFMIFLASRYSSYCVFCRADSFESLIFKSFIFGTLFGLYSSKAFFAARWICISARCSSRKSPGLPRRWYSANISLVLP